MIPLPIMKSLFLLFLVMAAAFTSDLFGCHAKKVLNSSIYTKHVVFFFLIYFTVDFTTELQHPFTTLYYTTGLWIFYLFIIRVDIYFTFIIAILLFSLYVTDEYFEYLVEFESEPHYNNSDNKLKIENIKKKYREKHKYLKEIVNYLEFTILITTLIGFLYYFYKQYKDKNHFSIRKFILGEQICGWEKKLGGKRRPARFGKRRLLKVKDN